MHKVDIAKWEERFDQLAQQDYVIIDDFLPKKVLESVLTYFEELIIKDAFKKAAIGKTGTEKIIEEIRGDYTYWLKNHIDPIPDLFEVFTETKQLINKLCYLSLADFEFHFAHYPKGSFYKKHLDQFSGRNNRMISMIIYLNKDWANGDGGELQIYPKDKPILKIAPLMNRCIMFRSDTLLHEVLMANKTRKSITGWMLYQPSPLITIAPQ